VAHESDSLDGRLPSGIAAALAEVAARLDAADVAWSLTGSTGRMLLGGTRTPRDLDIEVAVRDAERAGAALGCVLATEDSAAWSSLRGRAEILGVEVDVSAGVVVAGAEWVLEPDEALEETWSRVTALGGRVIRIAPPEEPLVRALIAGDWARIATLADGAGPPPRPAYIFRRLASARAAR
jgi:hypothetical protein